MLSDGKIAKLDHSTVFSYMFKPLVLVKHGLGNSAAARADANVIHKEGRRTYDLDENLDAVLKQEIIAAVKETDLSAKNHRYMGFHGVSSKNLMDHLMYRYIKIWTSYLEDCRQALAASIEMDRPIGGYFQRVEDSIQFA